MLSIQQNSYLIKHVVSPKNVSATEDLALERDLLLETAILSTQEAVQYQRFLRATQYNQSMTIVLCLSFFYLPFCFSSVFLV